MGYWIKSDFNNFCDLQCCRVKATQRKYCNVALDAKGSLINPKIMGHSLTKGDRSRMNNVKRPLGSTAGFCGHPFYNWLVAKRVFVQAFGKLGVTVDVGATFPTNYKCGRLEHGFLRVRCDKCHFERLVAFSCKKRGFCPNCGACRMAETAALLSDEAFADVPLRQRVGRSLAPPARAKGPLGY
jgi:hypothetical protein